MAKKAKRVSEETEVELGVKDAPERNPRQEREDRAASEFLGMEVKDGKAIPLEEEENAVEKKAKELKEQDEQPVEEPKPEVKEEGVEFDPDKLKTELIEELDKRIPVPQSKEEEKKQETIVDKVIAQAKAEGRNPTWEEAITAIAEEGSKQAYERFKKEQEDAAQVQKDEADQQRAAQEQANTEFNTVVDEQLADLYKDGKLTRIKNADDPNDTGVLQRKALFQTMMDVNMDRASKNLRPIYSIKEIFYEHYKNPVEQPPGADAPISIGRGAAKAEDPQEYSYHDVHGKDFMSIMRGR